MQGSRGEQATGKEWQEAEGDQSKKRSYVWPLVATFMTALAIGHIMSLRRRLLDFEKLGRQASRNMGESSSRSNGSRTTYHYTWTFHDGSKFYKEQGFSQKGEDEFWSRIWNEGFFHNEEDLRRVEEFIRMQKAFMKERAKFTRGHESGGASAYGNQQGRGQEWYWGGYQTPGNARPFSQANHYRVLGLDPLKAGTYTQADIKAAYRAKAMEYHPDRNQHRKEFAEAKFRDVVAAYEALKN